MIKLETAANATAARAVALALWGLCAFSFAAFIGLTALRLAHPIELGNGEGILMDHILRLAQGKPLYVAPSFDFIPLAYPPLFPALVAPLASLFGPALWEPRLVCVLAVVALSALMIAVIRRETGSVLPGVAGAAIFMMGHGLTGGYDVVRPDQAMLLLAFGAAAVLRFSSGRAGAVISALLFSAAFFTKQHALLFGGAALLHLAVNDRRRVVPFAFALALGCAGGFLALTRWLGPWYSFYTYDVPSHWSQFSRGRVLQYLSRDAFGKFAMLTVPIVVALGLPQRPWRGAGAIWLWMAGGGLGTGLLATLDPYAYFQVLMPSLAAFAVMGPIAIQRVTARLASAHGPHAASSSPLAHGLLALAFLPLLYAVHDFRPPSSGVREHRLLMETIREIPGPVMIPFHGYYGWASGKGMSLSVLALDDVMRARGNRLLRTDPGYFDRMFARLRGGPGRPAIVCDTTLEACGDVSRPLWASLSASYRLSGRVGEFVGAMRPETGNRNVPTRIYTPSAP